MDKHQKMELRREAGYRDLPKPQVKEKGPEYSLSYVCCSCRTSNMRQYNLEPCHYPKSIDCPICDGIATVSYTHLTLPTNREV